MRELVQWRKMNQFYCYESDCSVRTPEKPWPFGVFSENKTKICPHCKRKMTKVAWRKDYNGEFIE